MGVPAYLAGLLAQDRYRPVHLRSISIDPQTDRYVILLDKGDSRDLKAPEIEATTRKLLEYFKIGVALPNSMFWVNLRPDSDANIIDPYLERTDMGKVFLAADVQLKKDLARFTSPDTREGREYWNKLYARATELFGAQGNVTIPTVARPWIVPGEIILKQTLQGAYVHKAVMKVCLEQDWIKAQTATNGLPEQGVAVPADARFQTLNAYSAQLLRALIIPRLTREVNSSQRYSALRQVFYSLVLAQWYKASRSAAGAAVDPGLLMDSKDLTGLTSPQSWSKQDYYRDYRRSFQEGEYNKQEQVRAQGGIAIRRYFSGGVAGAIDPSSIIVLQQRGNSNGFQVTPATVRVEVSPEGITAQLPDGGANLDEQQDALLQPARDRVVAALDQRIAGGKRARNAAFISMAISGIFLAASFYLNFSTTVTLVGSAFAALVTFVSGMNSNVYVDHYQRARKRAQAAETLIPQDVIRIAQPFGDFHGIAATPFAIVLGAMTASLLRHGAYLLFNPFFFSAYISAAAITGLLAYKLWDESKAEEHLENETDEVVAEASGDKEKAYRNAVAAARQLIASGDNYSAEDLEKETNVLYLQELIAQIDALADSRGASGLAYRESDIKAMAQRRLLAKLISNRYTRDPVPFSEEYRRFKWRSAIFHAMYLDHDGTKKKALRSPYWDTVGIDLSGVGILTEFDLDRITESIIASTREEQDGGTGVARAGMVLDVAEIREAQRRTAVLAQIADILLHGGGTNGERLYKASQLLQETGLSRDRDFMKRVHRILDERDRQRSEEGLDGGSEKGNENIKKIDKEIKEIDDYLERVPVPMWTRDRLLRERKDLVNERTVEAIGGPEIKEIVRMKEILDGPGLLPLNRWQYLNEEIKFQEVRMGRDKDRKARYESYMKEHDGGKVSRDEMNDNDGGINDFSESGWRDYQAQRARDEFERETYERELRTVERERYFSSGDPDKDRAIAERIARERTDEIMRHNPASAFRDSDGGAAKIDDAKKAGRIGDELNDKDDGVEPVGGIDFRAVPVVPAAPAAIPALAAHPATLRQLERDWDTISRKLEQGEVPCAALKEYAAACVAHKDARKQLLAVSACIDTILRMEEDAAVVTSAEMKEILAIIG